jgi:hypothetical protein
VGKGDTDEQFDEKPLWEPCTPTSVSNFNGTGFYFIKYCAATVYNYFKEKWGG